MRNYYQVLQVSATASTEDIKHAFFQLAKVLHPDLNHASDAKERFEELNEAFRVLSHPEERALYDATLKEPKVTKDTFKKTSGFADEEQKKATIRQYRKTLIMRAIVRISWTSLTTMLIWYVVTLLANVSLFRNSSLWSDLLAQTYSPFSLIALVMGLVTGALLMIDKLFKIETFITTTRWRLLFHHTRTLFVSLGVAQLLVSFNVLLQASLHWNNLIGAVIVAGLGATIGTTISSDGEFWTRLKQNRWGEIALILSRTIIFGLVGAVAGSLVGIILLYLRGDALVFVYAPVAGYVLASAMASTQEQEISELTASVNKSVKSVTFIIASLIIFCLGLGLGYLLGKKL